MAKKHRNEKGANLLSFLWALQRGMAKDTKKGKKKKDKEKGKRKSDAGDKKKKKKKKTKETKNIDPLLVNAKFKQTGGSCVLASYAIAATYFCPSTTMETYFLGYCEHFGLQVKDAAEAEDAYASHFDSEWRKRNCRGYEVLLDLHDNSGVKCFARARKKMFGRFRVESPLPVLEKQMRSRECFLNIAYVHSKDEFHSITAFSDGKYLFGRDTNRPHCFLLDFSTLESPRDSVMYIRRKKKR